MKITTEMVDYISELSRLSLPEEEKAEMSRRIDASLQTYLASVVSPELLEETPRVLCGTE